MSSLSGSEWDPIKIIIMAVIYLAAIYWLSKKWYQNQKKGLTTRDVVFLGNGNPSPILTIFLRIWRGFPGWFITSKQTCISFIGGIPLEPRKFRATVFCMLAGLCESVFKRICFVLFSLLDKAKWCIEKYNAVIGRYFTEITIFGRHLPKIRITKDIWVSILEISIIIGWAFYFGRNCLGFSSTRNLIGGEYVNLLQSHFVWSLVPECGTCVFWNGFINGGAPAFVDTLGAVLHPLVVITSLLFGTINGSRVVLVCSLALAGISQWWLARTMKLNWYSRLWAAITIEMGGHLVGKMDNGNVVLVLSTASASFFIAALFSLVKTRRRSSLIWSGIGLALMILSGQGYIQIGTMLAIFPVFCLFLFDKHLHPKPVWKDFSLAVLLGVLLAGVFLVPFLHFLPNTYKYADTGLSNYQPLQYLPINLLINDLKYFRTPIMGHDPNIYTNYIYIGWMPVILALFAIPIFSRKQFQTVAFFVIGVLQIFIFCSKEFAQAIITIIPQIAYLRWGSIISGMTVPLVVAMAAWSLDYILKAEWWPCLDMGKYNPRARKISLSFAVISLPAAFCLFNLYQQSQIWLVDRDINLSKPVINELTPANSQWVTPNLNDYSWMRVILEGGGKLTNTWRPWFWKDHEAPPAYLIAEYKSKDNTQKNIIAEYDSIVVMRFSEEQYARVSTGKGSVPCQARSTGGLIDVSCNNEEHGVLTVIENYWDGWYGEMDRKPINLFPGKYLMAEAQAGIHTYQFRYQPWDVWVGLGVSMLGWLLALYLIWFAPKEL